MAEQYTTTELVAEQYTTTELVAEQHANSELMAEQHATTELATGGSIGGGVSQQQRPCRFGIHVLTSRGPF